MKKLTINLFSAFILLVFACSIFFFGISIHNEITGSDARTKQIFDEITGSVENNLDKLQELNFSSGSDEIQAVEVKHNEETVISFPNKEVSENVKGTKLIKIFNKTIVQDEEVYSIKASLYLLRPSTIYRTAKKTFMIILAATLITIICLIYISCSEKKSNTADDETESETIPETDIEEDNNSEENSDRISDDAEENTDSISENENEESSGNITEETYSENDSDENDISESEFNVDFADETAADNEISSAEENNSEANTTTENDEENPYYNGLPEDTNDFASEKELFITHLNNAITDSTSNEKDISLFLFELDCSGKEEEVFNTLDENFENSSIARCSRNIFAAFIADTNIDEAEDYASVVQAKLCKISSDGNCYAGISSKSVRMLDGNRLYKEAEEALCHAKEDPDSPIIGFHVDIEKYREFIKNS